MLVSVLVPVHGKAPYLNQAIASVVAQSHSGWELLLILDRPSVELLDFANQSACTDIRIKVFTSPGSGIVDALNYGMEVATGPLIARLDSDDVMSPSRIEKQLNSMMEDKSIGCVGSQMLMIDELGSTLGKTSYPCDPFAIRKTLKYQNCLGHPSVMFNKEVAMKLGSYRKVLTGVEDYDLWIRMSAKYKVINLNECLTKYRISAGQYSKTFGPGYTVLEDAARLDAIFEFISSGDESLYTIEELSQSVKRLRIKNLLIHPLKVFISFKGYFVSKILRITSLNKAKQIKYLLVIPYAVGLGIISPNTFLDLARKKLRE